MVPKQAEVVLNSQAIMGESPMWDTEQQVLYWVDIFGNTVNIFEPDTAVNRPIDVGQDVGTVVIRESGGLILAVQEGVACLDLETEAVQLLINIQKDGLRLNDGKCDPVGRFWTGTNAYDYTEGAGSLYCIDTDLGVRTINDSVTNPNGLVWSSDQKTFYHIDSNTYAVDAYDYDVETGQISNRRVAIGPNDDLGIPDGMAMDEDDNLWIATWDGGRVIRWDPINGELMEQIDVPGARQTTACAFGGPQLNELYITTARYKLNGEDLDEQPMAGSLFKVELDVKGVPANRFKG
jgi:sugar lactone lactonase YvrE